MEVPGLSTELVALHSKRLLLDKLPAEGTVLPLGAKGLPASLTAIRQLAGPLKLPNQQSRQTNNGRAECGGRVQPGAQSDDCENSSDPDHPPLRPVWRPHHRRVWHGGSICRYSLTLPIWRSPMGRLLRCLGYSSPISGSRPRLLLRLVRTALTCWTDAKITFSICSSPKRADRNRQN